MEKRDVVNGWLADISAKYHLGSNALNHQGLCAFSYRHGVELVIEAPERGELLFVWSPICRVSEDGRESLYRTLLELNLMVAQTHGAAFAVNARSNEIVLSFARPVDGLNSVGFENLIADFLETASRYWMRFNKKDETPLEPAAVRRPWAIGSLATLKAATRGKSSV